MPQIQLLKKATAPRSATAQRSLTTESPQTNPSLDEGETSFKKISKSSANVPLIPERQRPAQAITSLPSENNQ
jgi:hypothetical protein